MKKNVFVSLIFTLIIFNVYSQEIGIRVNTALGGILFFEGREIASLFDNDSYIIPIERPGTYSIRIRFANGREQTKSVIISSRSIVEISFLMPPNNIRFGNVGVDSLQIMWDNSGANISYNLYFNMQNHIESAQVLRNITSTTATLNDLVWNNTYYIWISVTESGIEGIKSLVLSQRLLETRIGQNGPAGGLIFYDKGVHSDGWRYLEMAPTNTEVRTQWMTQRWNREIHGDNDRPSAFARYGQLRVTPNDPEEIGVGMRYTRAIAEFWRRNGELRNPTILCSNLVINNFNDWFLPNSAELVQMYLFYRKTGLGGFTRDVYWSSSSYIYGVCNTVVIDFSGSGNMNTRNYYDFRINALGYSSAARGSSSGTITFGNYLVRAIRAF